MHGIMFLFICLCFRIRCLTCCKEQYLVAIATLQGCESRAIAGILTGPTSIGSQTTSVVNTHQSLEFLHVQTANKVQMIL